MADERGVLDASVTRLRTLIERLSPSDLRAQAYPSEWTIAAVLSHLGSGAAISRLWVDEALGGKPVAMQEIWDEWNAKDPEANAADALAADRRFLERLDAMTDDERARFAFVMGPIDVDLAGFLRLRINEHTLHTWDIAVTFDPLATLPPDGARIVFDVVPMIAGFTGRPTGSTREIRVHTTEPEQRFVIALSSEGVAITRDSGNAPAELALPAEAFVRLVYGRLDADHTPAFTGAAADLDELRRAFPGV